MNTQEFITSLKDNTGKTLTFELPDGYSLKGDLHITEVKNVEIESVDCGGRADRFTETHSQLWINEDSDKQAEWSTDKALKIYTKVQQFQDYNPVAEAFFEFGDTQRPAMKYTIQGIDSNPHSMTVRLAYTRTMCKPREEARAGEKMGCC